MPHRAWSKLSSQQAGRYAEYFVQMTFTAYRYSVYRTEVDDRGIDCVVRLDNGPYYEIQVKSLRKPGYVFTPKSKTPLAPDRLIVFAYMLDGEEPALYLIPSLAWRQPNALLKDRDYGPGKKSEPEWGLNVSSKTMPALEEYNFDRVIHSLGEFVGDS